MKVLSVLAIIGLILGGCSSQTVYSGGKRINQYPEKYEYRCVEDVCKDININYKYERIVKDKYKNLSEEELKNKEKKNDRVKDYISATIFFGPPIAVGITSGATTGFSLLLIEMGVGIIVAPIILFFAYSCHTEGDNRYYDRSCYTKPSKAE